MEAVAVEALEVAVAVGVLEVAVEVLEVAAVEVEDLALDLMALMDPGVEALEVLEAAVDSEMDS